MEKTELPTPARLEELRGQGLVPLSQFAMRSAGSLFVLLSFLMLAAEAMQLIGGVREVLEKGAADCWWSESARRNVARSVVLLLIGPAVAALLGALLCGLFQSRFLVRFSRVAPRFERLNPFRLPAAGEVAADLASAFVVVLLSLGISAVLLRLVIADVLRIALEPPADALLLMGRFFQAVLPVLIPLLAFSAFGAWLFARRRFFASHRMSRQEVLRENEDRA